MPTRTFSAPRRDKKLARNRSCRMDATMNPQLRLALVVHNHQPIGNFDHIVEEAYTDSYLPFLRALARRPKLRAALHFSGSLFDWLEERHPEYLDEVAALHKAGRVQILGGAYYEPILPMIPRRDRLAQIQLFSAKLAERFGAAPRGMWLAERVWEQQLAGDLAAAGIEHTIVDDFHFANAGLKPEQLRGYYLTEDEGRLLAVFPGNERLRYMIPFASPEATIDYMREVAEAQPGSTLVFADDGEKFGSWPGTKEYCRESNWLERFFELLEENHWIETTTPADLCTNVAPLGKIYLPDGSYREMTEWAAMDSAPRDSEGRAKPGNWRNFLVKYPEAGEMHTRMLMVSDRVERARAAGYPAEVLEAASRELYRAQCNCAYWHGTFGGVYLSHLRQAIYRHLIRADDLLDRTADRPPQWTDLVVRDHNLDAHQEVCLANDRLIAFFAPHAGGNLYELDLRRGATNVLATVARKPEAFHAEADHTTDAEVRAAMFSGASDAASRRSFVEHFYAESPSAAEMAAGRMFDIGDFAGAVFPFQVRRTPQTAELRMRRLGFVAGLPVRMTKTIVLAAGADQLTCEYVLENLPADKTFHFAVEFNFAGFEHGEDRYLQQNGERRLGDLSRPLEFPNLRDLELVDAALGLRIGIATSRPASFLTYPIRAVHRRQGGLEATHQATCVVPHWLVRADAKGTWSVTLTMPVASAASGAPHRDALGQFVRHDLGDIEPKLDIQQATTVTHTEVVQDKPEIRRKTTRRLKSAG
ncbi:MAG: DUF1926 domain-containing protein [Planctomycetia bacterium]|nr:DUF1926 domain-containing protein [Planctomycetia bacterium]